MLNLSKHEKEEKWLKNFQNILLNMNFFKIIEEEKEDIKTNVELEELPNIIPNKKWKIKFNNKKYKTIPIEFEDEQKYIKSFENLFLLEIKANLIISYNKTKNEVFKLNCDSTEKIKQYTYIKFDINNIKIDVQLNNLIFLNIAEAKEKYSLLGIVNDLKNDFLIIKVIVPFNKQDKFLGFFQKGKTWSIVNLINLSTYEREWIGLFNLENLFLKKYILNPKLTKNQKPTYLKINQKIFKKLEANYNPSQLHAIKLSLKKEGITLIQGPPGTGKTRTIVGIISALFSSKIAKNTDFKLSELKKKRILEKNNLVLKNWKKNVEKNINNNFENLLKKRSESQRVENEKNEKFKFEAYRNESQKENTFLICGCSNLSVDEIILAIMNKKVLNSEGEYFLPKIVRIGPNNSKEVEKFSLDNLANNYLIRNPNTKEDLSTIKNIILNESDIICTTISFAGSNLLKNLRKSFETVIIDEACQSKEISSLIPIQYKTKRLILIGDPMQLRAFSFSKLTSKMNFSRDLFSRLLLNNFPYFTLKIQYRMEPGISKMISSVFYRNKVKDCSELKKRGNLFSKLKKLSTFSFINVEGNEELVNNSYKNDNEAEMTVKILLSINKKYPSYNFFNIGIITPYGEQVKQIKKILELKKLDVEVNTVDSFQGREKEVIIFSGVRNNENSSIGFMHDKNRINVSLSRAKYMLIIIGNEKTLKVGKYWNKIISYCKNNKKFIKQFK